MRNFFGFLLGGGFLLIVAESFEWISLGYMAENLIPVGLGLTMLIWLGLSAEADQYSAPAPLRVILMRNVVFRLDDHPPVTLDVKKGFFSPPRRNRR